VLSFSYYLHERAEESRHCESIGYLIAIIGSVFLVGGIIQTLVTVQRPQWFLIFPYNVGSSPYDFLGLAFILLGVILFLAGIVLGVYYGSQRVWYGNALKESYKHEEERLKIQKQGHNDFSPLSGTGVAEPPSIVDVPEFRQDMDKPNSQEN